MSQEINVKQKQGSNLRLTQLTELRKKGINILMKAINKMLFSLLISEGGMSHYGDILLPFDVTFI